MNRALPAFFLAAVASFAIAQSGDSGTKVRVKRAVVERDTIVLDLKIEPGWHIYSANHESNVGNPTKLAVEGPVEIAGPIGESKPEYVKHDLTDPDTKEVLFTEEYYKHEGEVTFRVPVKGFNGGKVKGTVDLTACDADKCLPNATVRFTAEAAPGSSAGTDSRAPSPADSRGAAPPSNGAASRPGRKVVANPKRLGEFSPTDPVRIVEISYPDPVKDDEFDLHVVVEVGPEYHIYGLSNAGTGVRTGFAFPKSGSGVVLCQSGDVKPDPAPKHRKKEFEDYEYFEGRVSFDVPVRASLASGTPSTGERPFTFRFAADYQSCTMERCLLPAKGEFELTATAIPNAEWKRVADEPVRGSAPAAGTAAAPFVVQISTEPTTLAPDSKGTLVARVKRPDGKPIDATDARIDLGQGQNLSIDGSTAVTAENDGSLTLRLPLRVASDAPDRPVKITGRITAGGTVGEFAGEVRVMASLLGFFAIAALAALFALLTPCVFPMIPVTISFFTKQAESGQQHPAKIAFVYCVGIVASFTAIGGLFSALLSGDAANVFAGHWITQLVIGGLFVFFSLSLFGMFDLAVPAPIMAMVERTTTRRMALASEGKGISVAVLLMGLLFSITTFTCTAPFIGGLLAGASATGQLLRPMLGMLVFSSVLAVPFFFLAMFPAQLKKLPKAGGWLNETKVVMGFVELAAAVKFLNGADLSLGWNIFTRNVCLAMWIAIFALTGMYLIGLIRLPKDMPRQKTGVIPLLISILCWTIVIYLFTGLNGKPLGKFVEGWLPPIEEQFSRVVEPASDRAVAARVGWDGRFVDDFEGALKAAQRQELPLFIDFTGYTCANCRAVEAMMNHYTDVKKALENYVVAELHLDGADPVNERNIALKAKFGIASAAMPYYTVLDPTYQATIDVWGWLYAEPAQWKPKLRDTLLRWKTLKH